MNKFFRQARVAARLSVAAMIWMLILGARSGAQALSIGSKIAPPEAPLDAALLTRSLVSAGNTARLEHVFARARRGDKITVAVIGGSITFGDRASAPEKRYGNLVAQWWRDTFPRARVAFINAGIGATGSDYGALRANRDLLKYHPDFVIVETACNDPNNREGAETLEGLIRQILRQPEKPAVLLLFMNQGGANAQEQHAKVGGHYRLSMVSYRDALWPEVQAGRWKWEDFAYDDMDLNDRGHACAAQCVTHFLDSVRKAAPPDRRLPAVAATPRPLFSDLFEHVILYAADDFHPSQQEGWTLDPVAKCWRTDRIGVILDCEIPGRIVYAVYWRVRGPMGRALLQVDQQPPALLDGWSEQSTSGALTVDVLARNLKPGYHHIRIEMLPDQAPKSKGHEFLLFGIGAAGAK